MYLSVVIGFFKWKCIENLGVNQNYLEVNCKKKEVFLWTTIFTKGSYKK
jgi:hypothetical protein